MLQVNGNTIPTGIGLVQRVSSRSATKSMFLTLCLAVTISVSLWFMSVPTNSPQLERLPDFKHSLVKTNIRRSSPSSKIYLPKTAQNVTPRNRSQTALLPVFTLHKQYVLGYNSLSKRHYKRPQAFIEYGHPVSTVLPKSPNKVKRFLLWTPREKIVQWAPRVMSCGGTVTCTSSTNRSDLMGSDAVMIHARNLFGVQNLPKHRLPHQRWVHFIKEPPPFAWFHPQTYNGLFNWTASFRWDTDFPATFVTLYRRSIPLTEVEFQTNFQEITSSKKKLISHMGSNCWTPHTQRLAYLKKLQHYVAVDRYGDCGVLNCTRRSRACNETMKQYKFFMAMENSHCRDYVSEKSAKALFEWGAIPVVMGGVDPGDYERTLPPGSFIHTAAFGSPKQLAEYLKFVDKTPKLYEQYHRWRLNFTGKVNADDFWCKMCRDLYNMSSPIQTYRDFNGWYEQDSCRVNLRARP